jgi:putative colanic acid biosynthesis acetyltransferase WcaF
VNIFFFKNPLNPFSGLKVFILKLFGAKIGNNVLLKPSINIKYPWKLTLGDYSMIGENVWIDNLDDVIIGSNVCISQGAILLSGNHNYKKTSFDLILGKIILEDGVWICAKSIVCANVICKTHSILSVNSTATKNLEPYTIYSGTPAAKLRDRIIL